MPELTPAERRALRARAHHLHPVIMIGGAGLTPAVLKEIDIALKSHELIKIRVLGDERERREKLLAETCAALDASPVQQIGKILVVFRPRPEDAAPPKAQAPRRRRGKGGYRPKRTFQHDR
jgi:putative YhbY family RNA-binding protein